MNVALTAKGLRTNGMVVFARVADGYFRRETLGQAKSSSLATLIQSLCRFRLLIVHLHIYNWPRTGQGLNRTAIINYGNAKLTWMICFRLLIGTSSFLPWKFKISKIGTMSLRTCLMINEGSCKAKRRKLTIKRLALRRLSKSYQFLFDRHSRSRWWNVEKWVCFDIIWKKW